MSLDYKSIIDNLQTEKVINLMYELGADRHLETESYIIFPTICHNNESAAASMKLYFYKNSKIFYCYTNCEAQTIFKFLEHYYQARDIDYDWYNDVYLVADNCSLHSNHPFEKTDKIESIKEKYAYSHLMRLPQVDSKVLDVFIKQYTSEWLNDGISTQSMDKYNILFSVPQNKIVIPHYDVSGNLVGIRGRALDEWEIENVGKYLPIRIENQWYKHPLSLNLYGLNISKDNIKKSGICYLFESEKSCLQLDGFDMMNVGAAVCGSNFNKFQLKILMRYCQPKEIVICFDKEEEKGSTKYFGKLYRLCEKYKNYCNFSFIYDKENLLELKDSPTDKGEEVFKKLLSKRVKV